MWPLFLLLGMHALSLLWFALVRRDTQRFVDSQLWVVGDDHESLVRTPTLKWIPRLYLFALLVLLAVSFLLMFL